jgi:undecaprenyl-diphosphatase
MGDVTLVPLDMIAVACMAYVVIALLWQLGGRAVTRSVVTLYRKLLARPIAFGWLRR